MEEIRRTRYPYVRRNAVLVDEPQQGFRVRHQRIVDSPFLLGNLDASQPVREPFLHILLNETLFPNAGGIPFHRDGTIRNVRQHHGRDRLVVVGKFTFCDAVVRKQDFVGMGDDHVSLTTARADLSLRMAINRGCRSLP